MIKSKTKQNETAQFEAYRKFRNKLIDFPMISRQSCYQNFLKKTRIIQKFYGKG